jgi:hypothetical protein
VTRWKLPDGVYVYDASALPPWAREDAPRYVFSGFRVFCAGCGLPGVPACEGCPHVAAPALSRPPLWRRLLRRT